LEQGAKDSYTGRVLEFISYTKYGKYPGIIPVQGISIDTKMMANNSKLRDHFLVILSLTKQEISIITNSSTVALLPFAKKTLFLHQRVVALIDDRRSMRYVARQLNINVSTIQRTYQWYRELGIHYRRDDWSNDQQGFDLYGCQNELEADPETNQWVFLDPTIKISRPLRSRKSVSHPANPGLNPEASLQIARVDPRGNHCIENGCGQLTIAQYFLQGVSVKWQLGQNIVQYMTIDAQTRQTKEDNPMSILKYLQDTIY
ncbi:hypothetical protein C0J52_11290, partial [Blattella germanica]